MQNGTEILGKRGVVSVLVDELYDPPYHVLLGAPMDHHKLIRVALIQTSIDPHLHLSRLVDADHVLLNVEVAHLVMELRKASEGLVVQM